MLKFIGGIIFVVLLVLVATSDSVLVGIFSIAAICVGWALISFIGDIWEKKMSRTYQVNKDFSLSLEYVSSKSKGHRATMSKLKGINRR